jgi:RNA binding exosome subunit
MGILHINAAATAHELQDIDLVTEALQWFTGTEWEVDMTSSYHGPKVALLSTHVQKNKLVSEFVQRLGKDNSKLIQEQLGQRMDENNVIHARFDLEEIVGQVVSLTPQDHDGPVIKVRMKVAVYPGQDATEIAMQVFQ